MRREQLRVMDSNKLFALLLILMLSIPSSHLTLACGYCPTPTPKGPIISPPIIGKPPISVPPVVRKPPIVGKPPITYPPVIGTPPAPAKATCPVDALKFGACMDVLGQIVHIGDPAVSCCPFVEGLAGLEAALCLCTIIKAMLLNMDFFLPLALQLLVTGCGKSIPPGYTCPS